MSLCLTSTRHIFQRFPLNLTSINPCPRFILRSTDLAPSSAARPFIGRFIHARNVKVARSPTLSSAMEALQFDRNAKKLSLVQVDIPSQPGPNEIVVEVAFAGVCGTDLHIIDGEFPCKETPVTLGHEFSGVVSEIGSDVTHIKVGDRVAVDPNAGCQCCYSCTSGVYHLCTGSPKDIPVGIKADGGWAKFCKVRADIVFKLPDSVTLEQGALTEPISCLSHGWDRVAPIPMGSEILITGAGIIGVLWASILHLMGYRRIIVSEPIEARRKLVEGLGLNVQAVNPAELVERKTNYPGWGVNVVIDCSGNTKAIEGATELLKRGGKLVIFGVSPPAARISLSPYKIYKDELTILGVLVNPFSFPKAIGFIESLGDQYLDYKKLGIEVFTLDQYEEAIKKIREGSISKAMFKLR